MVTRAAPPQGPGGRASPRGRDGGGSRGVGGGGRLAGDGGGPGAAGGPAPGEEGPPQQLQPQGLRAAGEAPGSPRRGRLQGLRLRAERRGQDGAGGPGGRDGGGARAPGDLGHPDHHRLLAGEAAGERQGPLLPVLLLGLRRRPAPEVRPRPAGEPREPGGQGWPGSSGPWPALHAWFLSPLQSCLEKADALLLLFSFTDRASFQDLPLQISRLQAAAEGPQAPPLKMVVGTKFDQFAHTDVTERDVAAFRRAWGLPVWRVKSAPAPRTADGRALDAWAGLSDVAPLLNGLAEHLWRRDQAAAGLLPPCPAGPQRVTQSRPCRP